MITLTFEGDGYEDRVLNTELVEFVDKKLKDKDGTDIATLSSVGWIINPHFNEGYPPIECYDTLVITSG